MHGDGVGWLCKRSADATEHADETDCEEDRLEARQVNSHR